MNEKEELKNQYERVMQLRCAQANIGREVVAAKIDFVQRITDVMQHTITHKFEGIVDEELNCELNAVLEEGYDEIATMEMEELMTDECYDKELSKLFALVRQIAGIELPPRQSDEERNTYLEKQADELIQKQIDRVGITKSRTDILKR